MIKSKKLLITLSLLVPLLASCGSSEEPSNSEPAPSSSTTSQATSSSSEVSSSEVSSSVAPSSSSAHEHTFSSDWSKDATYHWHAATCEHTDQVSGKAEHTWNSGEVTTPATETTEGVKTYTCTVCGQTKTEVLPIITIIDQATMINNVKNMKKYKVVNDMHLSVEMSGNTVVQEEHVTYEVDDPNFIYDEEQSTTNVYSLTAYCASQSVDVDTFIESVKDSDYYTVDKDNDYLAIAGPGQTDSGVVRYDPIEKQHIEYEMYEDKAIDGKYKEDDARLLALYTALINDAVKDGELSQDKKSLVYTVPESYKNNQALMQATGSLAYGFEKLTITSNNNYPVNVTFEIDKQPIEEATSLTIDEVSLTMAFTKVGEVNLDIPTGEVKCEYHSKVGYQYNDTHYYKCSECGLRFDEEEHTYDSTYDVCTKCGIFHQTNMEYSNELTDGVYAYRYFTAPSGKKSIAGFFTTKMIYDSPASTQYNNISAISCTSLHAFIHAVVVSSPSISNPCVDVYVIRYDLYTSADLTQSGNEYYVNSTIPFADYIADHDPAVSLEGVVSNLHHETTSPDVEHHPEACVDLDKFTCDNCGELCAINKSISYDFSPDLVQITEAEYNALFGPMNFLPTQTTRMYFKGKCNDCNKDIYYVVARAYAKPYDHSSGYTFEYAYMKEGVRTINVGADTHLGVLNHIDDGTGHCALCGEAIE